MLEMGTSPAVAVDSSVCTCVLSQGTVSHWPAGTVLSWGAVKLFPRLCCFSNLVTHANLLGGEKDGALPTPWHTVILIAGARSSPHPGVQCNFPPLYLATLSTFWCNFVQSN